MECRFYEPQYPNKSSGPCRFINVAGPYGCDEVRAEFCYRGPEVECDCPRCTDHSGCRFWEPNIGVPEDTQERDCWTCRFENVYGMHGCQSCRH